MPPLNSKLSTSGVITKKGVIETQKIRMGIYADLADRKTDTSWD